MIKPYEIAVAAHEICLTTLIPNGISKPHDFPAHLETSGWYADAINNSGIEGVTGGAVARAIIKITNWDKVSPWPGHPPPEEVIEYLRNESS